MNYGEPMEWLRQNASAVTAISTMFYTGITAWLILENRKTRADEKLPCVIVRAREVPIRGSSGSTWWLCLVNVGRGPAFITFFSTRGIPNYLDGEHTKDIDAVIGPDVGDPEQQIRFAGGNPGAWRDSSVEIVVKYTDVGGRSFETQFQNGRAEFRRL